MENKILIIEDDEDQKEIIKARFKNQNFEIEFYDFANRTLQDIAKYFFDNKFHMIIADHDLSNANVGFTGSEFVDYMFELCPNLQMLILTALDPPPVSLSNHPVLIEARPGKTPKWDLLIKKIDSAIKSYKDLIDNSNSLLLQLSVKEKLTSEEQIEYNKASNFLSEIQFNIDNDVVNSLKGKTVSGKISEIADSLQRIEKILED